MWKSIFAALIAGLVVQESALGQRPVSSADVNIVSVTGAVSPKDFTCTVVINNQNDDDAQDAKVIVLMPLQVKKVRGHVSGGTGTETCSSFPAVGYEEYALCDLRTLPQGALGTPNQVLRTITVTSEPSTAGPNYAPTCSAFIYSAVGDIDKTNNYKAWK
jgi:hypothetical protein